MDVWGMRTWSMEHLSGGIESYLEPLFLESIEEIHGEPEVTPGFKESECDVLGRSHTSWESSPKETAPLDELKEGIGDLQEKVEDLAGCLVVAVDVLQLKSPVLLDIESLIFYFPSDSSSILSYFDHIALRDPEIGEPLEPGGFHLPCLIGLCFKALENRQGVFPLFRVDIGDLVYPPVLLIDLGSSSRMPVQVVFRMELPESLKLVLNRGKVIFVNDQVLPAVSLTQIEDGSSGKKAVETETDGKAGESLLYPFCQSIESLELTVLLGGVLPRILDELGHKGEDKPLRSHNLCLEHLVIVDGLFPMGLGEAMGAVSSLKAQGAGPIHIHHIVETPKPGRVEHLLSDEGLCHARYGFLSLGGRKPGVDVTYGIPMGEGVHIKEDLELLPGWLIVSQLVSDLSSCSEPEKKHEYSCKAKGGQRIGDFLPLPRLREASEDPLNASEKMSHCLEKNPKDCLLLLLVPINSGLDCLRIGMVRSSEGGLLLN